MRLLIVFKIYTKTSKQYEKNVFKHKYIILFDDIFEPNEASLDEEKYRIEAFGPICIRTITIFQTKS